MNGQTENLTTDALNPCPFCGSEVFLEKKPLWSGSHGYHGCYEFEISCKKCGCRRRLDKNDTIYRSGEEAMKNAVDAWNQRVLVVEATLRYTDDTDDTDT